MDKTLTNNREKITCWCDARHEPTTYREKITCWWKKRLNNKQCESCKDKYHRWCSHGMLAHLSCSMENFVWCCSELNSSIPRYSPCSVLTHPYAFKMLLYSLLHGSRHTHWLSSHRLFFFLCRMCNTHSAIFPRVWLIVSTPCLLLIFRLIIQWWSPIDPSKHDLLFSSKRLEISRKNVECFFQRSKDSPSEGGWSSECWKSTAHPFATSRTPSKRAACSCCFLRASISSVRHWMERTKDDIEAWFFYGVGWYYVRINNINEKKAGFYRGSPETGTTHTPGRLCAKLLQ